MNTVDNCKTHIFRVEDNRIESGGGTALSNTGNKRKKEYDFIKGFVMLLVTWGHVTNALFSGEVVYYFPAKLITATFAMPIYMAVSGFFFYSSIKKHTFKEHFISRVQRLLIPCVLWNIIIWLVVGGIKVILGKGSIGSLNLFGIWFLWALLICDLFMTCIVKALKNDYLVGVVVFLISVILIMTPFEKWYLAWVFPFFALGYFARNVCSRIKNKWSVWMISVALYILILPFYKAEYLVYYSGSCIFCNNGIFYQLGIDCFRFIIGLLGCIVFMGIAFLLIKECGESRLVNSISYVGRNSLQVYVLQTLFAERLMTMIIRNIDPLKNLLQIDYDITCNLIAPIVTIGILFCCLGVSIVIKYFDNANKLLFGG